MYSEKDMSPRKAMAMGIRKSSKTPIANRIGKASLKFDSSKALKNGKGNLYC